jgi:hypothetical protein
MVRTRDVAVMQHPFSVTEQRIPEPTIPPVQRDSLAPGIQAHSKNN